MLCPLKIHILEPNPQSDGMGPLRGHEGGAHINGINALIKVAQENSLTPAA